MNKKFQRAEIRSRPCNKDYQIVRGATNRIVQLRIKRRKESLKVFTFLAYGEEQVCEKISQPVTQVSHLVSQPVSQPAS